MCLFVRVENKGRIAVESRRIGVELRYFVERI